METVNEQKQPKQFLNCLSHFLWLIFIVIIFIIMLIISCFHNVPIIYSAHKNQSWNSSYDPHVFAFISDAHLSKYFPKSINDTIRIFNLLNETGVEKILVTGDICDNFGSRSMIKHGHQYIKDFNTYLQIVTKYPNENFIVASGNHDEFGIESYNSPKHYIIKYVDFYKNNPIYKTYDNFLISRVKNGDIDIFVMNPYHYPTVNAGLGYYMNIRSDMIEQIESVLSEPSNATARILITHFPLSYTTVSVKSRKTHKTLMDVMTTSNMTVLLAGHTHKELIIHRNATLEIHPWAIKRGNRIAQAYRFVTVDNGNFNDHAYYLKIPKPAAIVTYPITKRLVSDQTDFSYETFNQADVRVVHFSENPNLSISASCSCESTGYKSSPTLLKYQRIIRRNQTLYSTSLKKLCDPNNNNINQSNSTEFVLTFSGDFNHTTVFVAGNNVQLDREKLDTDVTTRKALWVIGIICWIIILVVWCPFKPVQCFADYCDWIWGKKKELHHNCKNTSAQCISTIFGFTYMKSQIYLAIPKWVQIVYFVFIFTPLFVPFCIIKVGKYYGLVGFFGYYLTLFAFDYWPLTLTCFFVLIVLLPSTIIFAEIAFVIKTKRWNYYIIIYLCLEVLHIALIIIIVGATLYQSTNTVLSILSPIFVFEPIVIFIMQIICIMKVHEKDEDEKDMEKLDNCDEEKVVNQSIKL